MIFNYSYNMLQHASAPTLLSCLLLFEGNNRTAELLTFSFQSCGFCSLLSYDDASVSASVL